MIVKHDGTTYSCDHAIFCDDEHFLILYDANGGEIISFYGVQSSIFDAFEFSNGTPKSAGCSTLTKLSCYAYGDILIDPEDFTYNSQRSEYQYSVELPIVSSNFFTFNIDVRFGNVSELNGWEHEIEQTSNGFILYAPKIPINGVYIQSVLITKVSNI